MALTLGDNFSYQGAKPLDARLTYSTVVAMKAVEDSTMYNGCIAYCTEADKTYQWKSTNTVDETLGKWREYNTGGGGGTSYTAGDGIDITENVISTEKSEEGAIDEIIDRYPTAGELVSIVNAFNKGDLYSTDERMIGQWIDGKPLYQKTFSFTTKTTQSNAWTDLVGVSECNIQKLVDASILGTQSTTSLLMGYVEIASNRLRVFTSHAMNCDGITIRYTKTTDQAVSIGDANEYSTSEKIIGTWINGKPLYQRTVTGTSPSETKTNTNWYDISSWNVDIAVNIRGFIINTPSNMVFFDGINTADTQISVWKRGNYIGVYTTATNSPMVVTIQYTKTT